MTNWDELYDAVDKLFPDEGAMWHQLNFIIAEARVKLMLTPEETKQKLFEITHASIFEEIQ